MSDDRQPQTGQPACRGAGRTYVSGTLSRDGEVAKCAECGGNYYVTDDDVIEQHLALTPAKPYRVQLIVTTTNAGTVSRSAPIDSVTELVREVPLLLETVVADLADRGITDDEPPIAELKGRIPK